MAEEPNGTGKKKTNVQVYVQLNINDMNIRLNKAMWVS